MDYYLQVLFTYCLFPDICLIEEKTTLAANPKLEDFEDTTGLVGL